MLNNWRSGVGKAAHTAVAKLFASDSKVFGHAEDRAAFVSDSLELMHFIYKHLDKVVSTT